MKTWISAIALAATAALAAPAAAATFDGEFWDETSVGSLNDAIGVIGSRAADATFASTAIDYPNGARNNTPSSGTLGNFLGTDAASLSGEAGTTLTGSIFRFTGFLDLLAGVQTFSVASDDGFRLTIGGVEIGSAGRRPFRTSTFDVDAGEGVTAFELIFFEDGGLTGVEFFVDGALAAPVDAPAPVPLPAGLPLMLGALGLAGVVARRRAAA